MLAFDSTIDPRSDTFAANRTHMVRLLDDVRALEQRTVDRSARSKPLFDKRGQLLPRERIALLIDPGSAFLELSALAGFTLDHPEPEKRIAGAGVITGIATVSATRCMVVASDSGIEAGSIRPMSLEKILRAQKIALDNKLPFVHLVESAGANLLRYKVDNFVGGGGMFRNLARLSAAGLPVVTVVHGSSTAGGAYMPGLSDYVVMVRGRARAFLAGPPLLKAATGEIATDEALGGAEMHTSVSGLGEYLAEDDADGVRIARDIVQRLAWSRHLNVPKAALGRSNLPPRFDVDELLGIMSPDGRKPVDMREVIARIVDDSDFLPFKEQYGAATVTVHASILGHPIGIVTNNGPIDPDGANKATHFIQACCQSRTPIVYLQNTTGFMVGQTYERGGMIKHGSKMIQAVANANVPQLTVLCGSSFGAGNYGMCGRALEPSFLFSWPNARTAVMGGEQAAKTMRIVAEASAARKGLATDDVALAAQDKTIVETFESQQGVVATSSLVLDDGVIDPRDTRSVLGLCLATCDEASRRSVQPIQFGVARP